MLTRREWLALAAAARLRGDAAGGAELWNSFEHELTSYDERRRKRLSEIRTLGELSALQQRVRRTLTSGIGEFPERTPLQVRQVGEIVRPDYVIEKIIFESRPGLLVTANVYRPKSTAVRRPAVVQTCGHYMEGKATSDYATACAALAMKGFVALIFDPWGQGERVTFRTSQKAATKEHVSAGGPGILLGRTLANYMIWDIMRAFDYLETRLDVDASRMGLLGHSGGGMMTLLTTPLEPRIKAAMSCCAVTTFLHKTQALLMADPEQIVPGVYAAGVDHPELIAAVAPRAFLIGAVLQDYVPLAGTRRTFEEVKPVFQLAGVPDRVGEVESDNEHMLDKNLREACYGWMMKHLMDEVGDTREPAIQVESEDALRCTKSGAVMDVAGARSVFDLNREEAIRLAAERKRRPLVKAEAVRKRLAMVEDGFPVGSSLTAGSRGELLVIASALGLNSAGVRQLAEQFTAAGFPVLAVDLRGWGETTPNPPGKRAKFSWDEFFAWRSFEMGRPLVGMRVSDLLSAARGVAAKYPKFYLVGMDAAGIVALHAAAVDSSIAGVAWQARTPWIESEVSGFVPGALREYDLPDLVRVVPPRPAVMVEAGEDGRKILAKLGL